MNYTKAISFEIVLCFEVIKTKRVDDCEYNSMVECAPCARKCVNCGWNPAVKEERTAQFLRLMKERKEAQ